MTKMRRDLPYQVQWHKCLTNKSVVKTLETGKLDTLIKQSGKRTSKHPSNTAFRNAVLVAWHAFGEPHHKFV